MGSTLTTFDAYLHEYTKPSLVETLLFKNNTLLGMLEKSGDTKLAGDVWVVPVQYGQPAGGGSRSFSTAQTNASNVKAAKFAITPGSWHGVVHIGDKVLEASRNNVGAFVENKKLEIDGAYNIAGDTLSLYSWGNGGQALGRISTVSSTEIQLETPSDVANFEIDMVLEASANDGSDASHTKLSGSEPITGVNNSNGVLTAAAWTDISSIAAGNYLFRQDDFYGDSGEIVIAGVRAWISATDSPPALWTVTANTRATQPQRLAGCRVPAADLGGLPIDERILKLFAYMMGRFKVANPPDAGFLHPEDFQTLATTLSGRGIRPLEDANTKFGYTKIDVQTSAGSIPIYTDRHCPKGHFFALRMKDWSLASYGELVHTQGGDGLKMLRRASSTDYEVRLLSYPALGCAQPMNNGRVPL